VCPLRRTRVPVPGSFESDERLAQIPGMVHRPPSAIEPVDLAVTDDSELF